MTDCGVDGGRGEDGVVAGSNEEVTGEAESELGLVPD